MERDDWRFEIEIHPPGWKCPAGSFWIAGWIVSRSGRAPADVRAWLGNRTFLGLCGMPRPEIEAREGDPAKPLYAGFCFLVEAPAGAREFRFDVCAAHQPWEELYRSDITTEAGAASAPATDPFTPERIADLLGQMLNARLRRPQLTWRQLADETLAAENTSLLETLPNPPFYGALERPEPGARAFIRSNRLYVTGWLAHREMAILRLVAFIDSAKPADLLHGLPRPDLTGSFAELRGANRSKFAGYLDVPAALPHPANLRIFAHLDDGRCELVFNKRIRPRVIDGDKPQMPPLSRLTLGRAAWTLRRALRRRASAGPTVRQWGEALKSFWPEYRAESPHRITVHLKPAEARGTGERPVHVTLVTHNLNREGAPLIALEHARHLAAQPGWRIRVISSQDGPLRSAFEAAGLSVKIVHVQTALGAEKPSAFFEALERDVPLASWAETDIVIANTMVSFWAVHLARRLRKPSMLYLHESTRVRHFFGPILAPALFSCVEDAFRHATRVVFSAAASQAVFAPLEKNGNFRVLPGWIDTGRIATYAASHGKADRRRKLGLPEDAVVFANIGSVCERKGQHVFVEAIEQLQRIRKVNSNATATRLVFLMVGASPGPYLDLLRHDLVQRGLRDVQVVEQAIDSYAYYRAADIFVCSSFEESFPRVVMEAAVFGLPIVSTDVNGIPEMLTSADAWLVPPGDATRMAAAMDEALTAHLCGDRTRAERARGIVTHQFDTATLLPRHAQLAAAVAAMRPA